eukprot:jgi/Mesen1/8322/ME000457S07521
MSIIISPNMVVSTASPAHIKVADLCPKDGVPSDQYKAAVGALTQSLSRCNTAIVQLRPGDEILLKYALESARMYFQHKRRVGPDLHSVPGVDEAAPWTRTTGFREDISIGKEVYDFRPGTLAEPPDDPTPPSCLPELFSTLGLAARIILEAIGRSLDVRTFALTDLLDNMPLKSGECSSSLMTATCHGRQRPPPMDTLQDPALDGKLPLGDALEDVEPKAEKGLLALIRPDRPGLFVRDPQGRWLLADHDLGPLDVVLVTGLTLYQGSAGKPGRKRKVRLDGEGGGSGGGKAVPPSKKLRLEAQRVLKEKVQDLADAKGIKIHFCNYKDCEELHMLMVEDPPCAFQRSQLSWPPNVPFVHPHDLNNKAKQAFLEAYEPGWTDREGSGIAMFEVGPTPKRGMQNTSMVPVEEVKYQLKLVYDFLRANNKPVPTGKPQVVGQKVDLSLLCKLFDMGGGFQRFANEFLHNEHSSEKERERALERLKKLYDQVLHDYVEHLLAMAPMEQNNGYQVERLEGPAV